MQDDSLHPEPATEPMSRNIPLPIQREVRQRCGFGCVICGLPLYEYDHLLGWANVKRHAPDEITLLCDKHHREKTSGLLPDAELVRANGAPYNLRAGVSKPYDLHYSGSECEVEIGGNRFVAKDRGYGTTVIPITVDEIPLLGFILGDGHLLLNANLFDENNDLVLRIVNNQLLYSVRPWDVQLVGRHLTIREAAAQILIEIEFAVPNRVAIRRGRLLCNGVEILIHPDHILLTNNRGVFRGSTAIDCPRGLVIGRDSTGMGAAVRIDDVTRYVGDRTSAEQWAKQVLGEYGPQS